MATDYNIQSIQPALRSQTDVQAPKSQPVQALSTSSTQRNESAASGEVLPSRAAKTPQDSRQLESAVSKISEFVQNFQRDLTFSVDKDSGRIVIKVIDSKTKDVIRQIPSEVVLRLAKNLQSPDSLILREQA